MPWLTRALAWSCGFVGEQHFKGRFMCQTIFSESQPDLIVASQPINMMMLNDRMCKFPTHTIDGEQMFCGKDAMLNRPYCIDHHAITNIPLPAKKP